MNSVLLIAAAVKRRGHRVQVVGTAGQWSGCFVFVGTDQKHEKERQQMISSVGYTCSPMPFGSLLSILCHVLILLSILVYVF